MTRGDHRPIELDVNHKPVNVDCNLATPLLWALRDHLDLTGTKFGCDVTACGACTVRMDDAAVRSCVLPVVAVTGKHITTVEELAGGEGRCHALQQTWIDKQIPQRDYYQSGMLMAAADLLAQHPDPTDTDIDAVMTNICRCGTYPRMCAAIRHAARTLREGRT